MKDTGRKCNHPLLTPYDPFTGEKRKQGTVYSCDCGKTTWCDVCGYGSGQWPCDCSKPAAQGSSFKGFNIEE